MGMHWTGALNEEGVRPGTAAARVAAPSSLSALTEGRARHPRGLRGSAVGEGDHDLSGQSWPAGCLASPSVSALAATAPTPQGHGRPFLGSGRAQLAVFAAVMLGSPLGVALTVITEAVV